MTIQGGDQPETAEIEATEEVELFIVFIIDGEEYAVHINEVREVLDVPAITPVPDSPPFVLGIMNLRGKIVPIVDLEKRLNLHRENEAKSRHILITDYQNQLVGIKVDEVKEVLRVKKSQIRPAPTMISAKIAPEFLGGVVVISSHPPSADDSQSREYEPGPADAHSPESRVLLMLALKEVITIDDLQGLTEQSADNPEDHETAEHKEGGHPA